MRVIRGFSWLFFLALAVLPFSPRGLSSQNAPADSGKRYPSIPRSQRPSMVVMGFDFNATLSDEDRDEMNSIGALVGALRGNDATNKQQMSNTNLGRGVADLLMSSLLESDQFRIMDRKALDAIMNEQNLTASDRAASGQIIAQKAKILGAQYIVTGAITKMGHEKNQKGLGGLSRFGRLGAIAGAVGTSKDSYVVGLTVRVVDASTGEVVSSLTSEGTSEGGRGLVIGGGGGGGGGIFGSKSSGDREKRIGEAVAAAVQSMTDRLVQKRTAGDIEPPRAGQ
jgi:curli biogenesis system outer membrane secretion channel CsgG